MQDAVVIRIFIAPEAGTEMIAVNEVSAVMNRGLIGDRYYKLTGTFSKPQIERDQEITLIEFEAIEELVVNYGVKLELSQSRRNIVTQNVKLNNLVAKQFQVGEVSLTGIRLCEPCKYLSKMTGNRYLDPSRKGIF